MKNRKKYISSYIDLRNAKRSGFTLVEIIAAIVVIVFIAGLGMGVSREFYKSMLAKNSAREFYLVAKHARIFAVETHKQCTIMLNAEDGTYGIMVNTQPGEQQGSGKKLLKSYFSNAMKLKGDMKFEKIEINVLMEEQEGQENNNNKITFYPDGTADSALIQISDGRNRYAARISPATGRIVIQAGSIDDILPDVIDLDLDEDSEVQL